MAKPLAQILEEIKNQKLTEGKKIDKPTMEALIEILKDFDVSSEHTPAESETHGVLCRLKENLPHASTAAPSEAAVQKAYKDLQKQLAAQPTALSHNSSTAHSVSAAASVLAGFSKTSKSMSTPEEQVLEIFESGLREAAESAVVRGINYERALGEAQIVHSVSQMAKKGEYTVEEIAALQKKEDAKAKAEHRKPRTLTKEYLGEKVDRSPEMQRKMAEEKEKRLKALESRIGFIDPTQTQQPENSVLKTRIAKFQESIRSTAKEEIKRLSKSEGWAALPIADKRRKIAAKLQEVAEKKLDVLYPNHNTAKYIAAHPKLDEEGNPIYKTGKKGEKIPVPAEDHTQRLPGAVAFALNPQNLWTIIANRREGGIEEEEQIEEIIDPPAIEIVDEIDDNPKPTITIENKGMRFFFTEEYSKALEKEKSVTISIPTNISPEKFRKICLEMQDNIQRYNDANTSNPVFQNVKVNSNANNSFQISRDNEPLVEMVHIPPAKDQTGKSRPGKIDILLTDPKQQDESLLLMVASAKNVLEKLGKAKFNIENCENNPETAVKLYLTGLSMGLEPQFKDTNGETMKAIEKSDMKVTMGDKELTLKEVLAKAHEFKGDEHKIKEYMKALEVEEPKAKNSTAQKPSA